MSRFLLAINSCLALLLIGSEELRDWEQHKYWQVEEQGSQTTFSPVLSKESQQAMSVDYWPDSRIRTFHALNLPMSVLLGWYSHPLSIQTNSIFGTSLLRVCQRLSVKSRVVILDAVLQWWLVGLWLEHPAGFVRVLKIIAVAMTVIGIVMTLLSVPRSVGETAAVHDTVGVLSLMLILAWVFLAVIGALFIALRSARKLRASSQLL